MGLEHVLQKESIVGGLNRVGEIAGRKREMCGTTGQCLPTSHVKPLHLT